MCVCVFVCVCVCLCVCVCVSVCSLALKHYLQVSSDLCWFFSHASAHTHTHACTRYTCARTRAPQGAAGPHCRESIVRVMSKSVASVTAEPLCANGRLSRRLIEDADLGYVISLAEISDPAVQQQLLVAHLALAGGRRAHGLLGFGARVLACMVAGVRVHTHVRACANTHKRARAQTHTGLFYDLSTKHEQKQQQTKLQTNPPTMPRLIEVRAWLGVKRKCEKSKKAPPSVLRSSH
jgi:hypothetical protein